MNVNPGYNDAVPITKSDTVDAPWVFDALYVGGAGAVVIVLNDAAETVVTFAGVPAGLVLRVQGKRVNATNTVPTDFVGLRRV